MATSNLTFEPLRSELDQLATTIGVDSVLIMHSEDAHMRVDASAGPMTETYPVGAKGKKGSAFADAHELYCERVVSTDAPMFVRDSRLEREWSGNEDEKLFGLVNYLGYPLHRPDGSVYGTVCVLSKQPRDFTDEERQMIEDLQASAERLLSRG